MGILELLLVVFIVLKLTGFIAWSWWWVLSPIWLVALFWGFIAFCCVIVGARSERA